MQKLSMTAMAVWCLGISNCAPPVIGPDLQPQELTICAPEDLGLHLAYAESVWAGWAHFCHGCIPHHVTVYEDPWLPAEQAGSAQHWVQPDGQRYGVIRLNFGKHDFQHQQLIMAHELGHVVGWRTVSGELHTRDPSHPMYWKTSWDVQALCEQWPCPLAEQ